MSQYNHDNALNAAEDVIEVATQYDGADEEEVQRGLKLALSCYVCSRRDIIGNITGEYSIEGGTPQDLAEDGVEVARNSIQAVYGALKDEYSLEDEDNQETLMSAEEHLVNNPAKAFDAESALEG